MFIRFVSRFTSKLFNAFFISSYLNLHADVEKKIRTLNLGTKHGVLAPRFPITGCFHPASFHPGPPYISRCSSHQPTSSPTSPLSSGVACSLLSGSNSCICMEGLTGEQRLAFQEAFSLFDKNGDGLLPLLSY